MDSRYDHTQHEHGIYQLWESQGKFTASADASKKPFCIIMPPPNANDPLHVGHAMFISIEDILIRFHRMLGESSLWVPGTDHAGIETQYVFEKKLSKQGKSRFQFDRDTLYQMIWEYVQQNSGIALDQMKQLGASADWSRYKFTLDPDIVDQVLHTFETMAQDNLIYRGERLVNYCVKCGTAYSELEVKYVERPDPLYYIKYGPFTLATVRPETKFGDTAVAVNPKDSRYTQYIGQEIEVKGLAGVFKLQVIADDYVDPEFGTGVVKVTPAHDPNDYAMGQRHHLAMKQVIGFDGKLTEVAGKYAGLKVAPARETVVKDLQAKGLMEKIDTAYVHNVATCYRCGSVIEPLPMAQFFINVKPLTKKVLAALDAKETHIHGAGHDKILRHWLANLQDWNISRQIVWGIRMPVWYDVAQNPQLLIKFLTNNKQTVTGTIGDLREKHSFAEIEAGLQSLSAPKDAAYVVSRTKPAEDYLQETDTFDTWFSSSQWPVVTLKTNQPGDFDYFYPTSVMETGYDILPFWVMRMMMMGGYLTDQMPFKDVYLHGLVRDEKGQKMSKSKGNVVNPLDLVAKYGADALRMALVMSTTAGHDSAVGEMKVKGMRNFTNKVWNAARFVQLKQAEAPTPTAAGDDNFNQHLAQVVAGVTQQLTDFKIGLAAETAHNEFWHWYCDQAIEACKQGTISTKALFQGLLTWLKLLHPFMPFVTESIWQQLDQKDLLISQTWPQDL